MIGGLLVFMADRFAAAAGSVNCGDGSNNCTTGLPVVAASSTQLQQILTIVLAVLGAIAVLMIVIAGLRFIAAQGNPQEVAKARSTLLYAIIGLVVVAASETIIALVLGKL